MDKASAHGAGDCRFEGVAAPRLSLSHAQSRCVSADVACALYSILVREADCSVSRPSSLSQQSMCHIRRGPGSRPRKEDATANNDKDTHNKLWQVGSCVSYTWVEQGQGREQDGHHGG